MGLLFPRSMIKLWVYTRWGPYPFNGGWPLVSIVKTVLEMCQASCCHAFRDIDFCTGSSASFANHINDAIKLGIKT